MPDVGTWAKLAAYVVCTGLALELAHRSYWSVYARIINGPMRTWLRALASAGSASFPLISVLAVTFCFCLFVDKEPLSILAMGLDGQSMPLFAFCSGIALISVALLFISCRRAGLIRAECQGIRGERFPAFFGSATDFLQSAVFEEVMVRGYIFWVIFNAWGPSAAVVGSAVLFSAFHIVKHPRIPIIFTINAFLFGLITAQARLMTGSLWAPIGLHFGWNIAMGPIFGLPCSGRTYDSGYICCTVEGPDWLTGGLYSPDAGIIGSVTLVVATVAMMMVVPIH